jgi:hypothetical protein
LAVPALVFAEGASACEGSSELRQEGAITMTSITLVWGRREDASNFTLTTYIHLISAFVQSIQSYGLNVYCDTVVDLIAKPSTLPWWTLVWTVQEYIAAKQPVFKIDYRTNG